MKRLLGLVLASLALVSVAQARFYIGVEGAYSATTGYDSGIGLKANSFSIVAPSTKVISDALEYGPNGFSVGAVFGTEDFYGKYFGTRWGLGAGYTRLSFEGGVTEFVDVGFNFDLLLNFFNNGAYSFGIFGGVAANYHYGIQEGDNEYARHLFDFDGRVGVTTLLASHHRLEFFAKLPVASMSATSSNKYELGGLSVPAKTSFGASYKFVF